MKKSMIKIAIGIFAFSFISCGTTKVLSTVLETTAEVAKAQGNDEVAAIASAGAKTSAAVDSALEEITPENEYYIGRSVAATILTNYKTYESAALEKYLNEICGILVANSDAAEMFNGYHVKMLDSKEVNAFSTSGGHILVTRGLIECSASEDELAAVIAHEIAHVQLKHSLKAIKTSRWKNAGLAGANAALTAVSGAKAAEALDNMVGDVITQMVNTGYSKSQEYDADSLALTLMSDAGYNPSAMKSMLNRMESAQNTKGGFFKTHPTPAQRIANVNKEVEKISLPADTSASRKSRFAKVSGAL